METLFIVAANQIVKVMGELVQQLQIVVVIAVVLLVVKIVSVV